MIKKDKDNSPLKTFCINNFYSYNEKYAGCDELAPVPGQSPVEKYLALEDVELGIRCVRYFVYTRQLYSGIDWAKQIQ